MDINQQPSAEPSPREQLGLAPFPPLSDAPSPIAVDRTQIRNLLEGRLSLEEAGRIHDLIHTHREWHNAELEVILEQHETWRQLNETLGDNDGA